MAAEKGRGTHKAPARLGELSAKRHQQNRVSAPPKRPVNTSKDGVPAAPAHKVAAVNNLTSPPPRKPRANSAAPTMKTASAQPIALKAPTRLGAAAKCSGQATHKITGSRFGMTNRRKSSNAANAITTANTG